MRLYYYINLELGKNISSHVGVVPGSFRTLLLDQGVTQNHFLTYDLQTFGTLLKVRHASECANLNTYNMPMLRAAFVNLPFTSNYHMVA